VKHLTAVITVLFLLSVTLFAQHDKDQDAIRKVMDDQAAAWNRGDIASYMDGYWRSEKLVFISGDTVTRGWQPTLERYKKSYDTRAKMGTLTFSDLEITILSKDAAVVLGSWSLSREKDNPKGKFTLIFRKLKEGWRVVMDHTS
jgi:ketosteroid isomerase-like protein